MNISAPASPIVVDIAVSSIVMNMNIILIIIVVFACCRCLYDSIAAILIGIVVLCISSILFVLFVFLYIFFHFVIED